MEAINVLRFRLVGILESISKGDSVYRFKPLFSKLCVMVPTPKEAFVRDIMTVPMIPRPLTVFFAIVQFLFGFNFGFVKQMNNYKMAAQTFSVLTGLIVSGFLGYSIVYPTSELWAIYAVQYFLTFIILIARRYTVYDFLVDSNILGIKTGIQEKFLTKNLSTVICMCSLLMFCLKFILSAIFSWDTTDNDLFIIRFLIVIPCLALDVIPVINFLIFYHIYDQLKHLCLRFRDNNISMFEVQAAYKSVLDILDKIRPTIDNLIVLGFVTDCPKWIATTWSLLRQLKEDTRWSALGSSYAYAIHLTVQMCVPAVCAELMQGRTDALNLLVQERLLVEQDETTCAKLAQLARYIKVRPPLRKAWRLLPPGLQLPIAMLSMCATQLIVVIQFTHLYD